MPPREESWWQSAVVALGLGISVVGTAVDGLARTLGNGRGVLVPHDHPHALAAALSRVLAGCCWNTTTSAPAPSTRCGWSPMTGSWCWGQVPTKTSRIETPEQIKTRLREASSLVDAERLALSPQCGFATSVAGNAITPQAQRAKLALLVRAARDLLPASPAT